jgi:hypothetical protein
MKNKLLRLLRQVLAYVPTPLPQTDAAIESWIVDICDLADFPLNDSTRHAVATVVMHTPMPKMFVAKQKVITELKRSKANQAAWNVIQAVKDKAKKIDVPSVS